jgi:hypothetical protein
MICHLCERMRVAEIRTRLAVTLYVGFEFVSYYYCRFLRYKLLTYVVEFHSLVSIVSSCLRKSVGVSSCKLNA